MSVVKTEPVSLDSKKHKQDLKKTKTFSDLIRLFEGEKLVVIAARYQYHGIVSHVVDDAFVLSNAVAIGSSGKSDGDGPSLVDNIGTSIIIKNEAVELIYFPRWVNNKLPGE